MKKTKLFAAASSALFVLSSAVSINAKAVYMEFNFSNDARTHFNEQMNQYAETFEEYPEFTERVINKGKTMNSEGQTGSRVKMQTGEPINVWFSENENFNRTIYDEKLDSDFLRSTAIVEYRLYDDMNFMMPIVEEDENGTALNSFMNIVETNFPDYENLFNIGFFGGKSHNEDGSVTVLYYSGFEVAFKSEDHQKNYETAKKISALFEQEYGVVSSGVSLDSFGLEFIGIHWEELSEEAADLSNDEIYEINSQLAKNGLKAQIVEADESYFIEGVKINNKLKYEDGISAEERNAVIDFLYENYGINYNVYSGSLGHHPGTSINLLTNEVFNDTGLGITLVNNSVSVQNKPDYSADYIAGDANADGSVNIADAVFIQQYLVNPDKYQLSEQGKFNADVHNTGDGITAMDAVAIQEQIAGL